MDPHEATIANALIWSAYLRDQWARPRPGERTGSLAAEIADGVAATVAVLISMTAEAWFSWLYGQTQRA